MFLGVIHAYSMRGLCGLALVISALVTGELFINLQGVSDLDTMLSQDCKFTLYRLTVL